MMPAAHRDGELIADLAPKCTALREAQVMGIAGLAATDQAGLMSHMPDVLAIPHPARLRERQGALVDRFRLFWLLGAPSIWLGRSLRRRSSDIDARSFRVMSSKAQKLGAEALVDVFGIRFIEPRRLVRISPLCPSCRLVTAAKFVEFGNHLIAQPCRKLGIEHDGIANRRCLLRPLDGRAMVNPPLIGIEPAIGRRGSAGHVPGPMTSSAA